MNWLHFSEDSAGAYAFAAFLVGVASVIRWVLSFLGDDVFVFAAYYPAILFVTYVGGARVGGFAAVLGAVIAWWAFLQPHFAFFPLTSGSGIRLLGYLFACSLIVWGAEHYRSLMKRLQDEEKFRKLAVEELSHRLKNKLATMQSIISFRLREHPHIKDEIIASLCALAATDELIMATQGRGAHLRDILAAEFAPYDVARISMEGPNCLLSPRVALTIALLIHELATNAAKYGAFSNSEGKVSVAWSLSNGQLNLAWRESGGPVIITIPRQRGFGTRLMSRALDQFGGRVETAFETTGLVCKLSLILQERVPTGSSDLAGKGPQ